MTTALEGLERRVAALESEVAELRQLLAGQSTAETPAERGVYPRSEAEVNQAALSAGVAKAFAEMGISGEPIAAEKLQEMIRRCGVKPEDNEFSRGIIAMREE